MACALLLSLLLLLGATLSEGLAEEPPALVQQGPKLTGAEEIGAGRFGRSVALSADGDTALIGGPRDSSEAGAAWVLVRSGSTWTQQAKLTLPGEEELGEGHFGRSVALSADGDTALIGAPNNSGGRGAVWVYTRSGSTWTQQAKLTGGGESGGGWFGRSVALSADGETALIGGFVDHSDIGAAWVFTRSGSAWAQQGEKLSGAGESGAGEFGWSVALSADGGTALIGGHEDGAGAGAAWVFTRSGSAWAQQGEKLSGAGESGAGEFGQDVALSADGDTALIGAQSDNGVGAAWVFTHSGSAWAQQGEKLTGADETGAGYFGDGVALSANGDTALIGGFKDDSNVGAAWVFTRSDSTWTQRGSKLTGGEESGRGQFGWSVALSADGGTALIGGLAEGANTGAAWVFVDPSSPPESQTGGETPPGTQSQSQTQTPASSADPSSPARQGVAAYKAAGGGVLLLGRRIPVRSGRARVRIRCTAPVACRGRLTFTLVVGARAKKAARGSGMVTIAKTGFSIPRGTTATVRLTLAAAARARLRTGHGHLGARLAIHVLAPDPAGTRTYAVKLVSRR